MDYPIANYTKKKTKKTKEKSRMKYAILDFFKELSSKFTDASLSFKTLFHG